MGFFNNIDWKEVAKRGFEIAEESMEKKQKDLIRQYQKILRKKSDREIICALRNIEPSNQKYIYVQEEAVRRGLYE
ncbi:hypothetical protein [Clostridium tyrobutyricum]|uniref:hypothetical protein n=1 Tax=Clostridium tyrobutyricum TaxID=1519 RepID=UPI0030D3635B